MGATPRGETALRHLVRLAAGTAVHTLRGTLPVEALREGDRVIARSGAIRLERVWLEAPRDVEVVHVGAGTVAHGRPEGAQRIPADQPLLLRGERADLVYGRSPVTVPARRIVDGRLTRLLRVPDLRLVTLAFAAPAAIQAGDLEPVTCPESAAASA
ncbi:Hint domain-containing protein [Cereibacter azotoformans]|uniref:Hint domain-containing protein n=1 Tax=Cereibacter azotoformans TaxID=43057 RepID=A0A2T5JTP8_9RHOB|nr:Hint domain-containing protein [Cereibacter azotoformans]AXQ93431.1 iron-regulated protein frpC [Cereibacter sphaeroides]MBO4168812.1 Hint domain-containing protein [Cereibacter azotoformans]PTR13543.1 Hint domain-containing protein [Cereibacter azotoformans]UIJ31763.1 Hint domain-containing protein [Cereibacter azotoformans]